MTLFIKVEYGSSHNISVQGVDYFEVAAEDLDGDGNVPDDFITSAWQEAVNDFMADTSATVVDAEGD